MNMRFLPQRCHPDPTLNAVKGKWRDPQLPFARSMESMNYFRHEFNLSRSSQWPAEIRRIEFWDVDRWQDLR
jgi:hypothetical protein